MVRNIGCESLLLLNHNRDERCAEGNAIRGRLGMLHVWDMSVEELVRIY